MSRHEVPAIDPRYKIVIGWDPPLQTFFGQVHDLQKTARSEDPVIVDWFGCSPREIYEVEDLARRLKRHAKLSPEIMSTLYGDKDEGR